jgi:hypothetical protein
MTTAPSPAPQALAPPVMPLSKPTIWDPYAGRLVDRSRPEALPPARAMPAPAASAKPAAAKPAAPVKSAAAPAKTALPAQATAAPTNLQAGAPRRYSVHRQFGLQPDPTPAPLPDSFFMEPVMDDPADPPAPESRRDRESRRGATAAAEPAKPTGLRGGK